MTTSHERKGVITHDGRAINPRAGYCFVQMESLRPEVDGGIIIPDEARQADGFRGKVLVENPLPSSPRGFTGRIVQVAQWSGQRFDLADGRRIYVYPLDLDVLIAVWGVSEEDWVTLKETASGHASVPDEGKGMERCRSCRSSGRGNIFLDGNGVCPNCGKTASGKPQEKHSYKLAAGTEDERVVETDKPVTVSEEEKDRLSTPAPKVVKGTVISYPGQTKR